MGLEKEMEFQGSHSEHESRGFTRTEGAGWHPLWGTRETRRGKRSLGCPMGSKKYGVGETRV